MDLNETTSKQKTDLTPFLWDLVQEEGADNLFMHAGTFCTFVHAKELCKNNGTQFLPPYVQNILHSKPSTIFGFLSYVWEVWVNKNGTFLSILFTFFN